MATYKVNVIQKLGKYHMAMWEATGSKVDPAENPAQDNVNDVLKSLQGAIESGKLEEGKDSIIFRGIAYEDFVQLTKEISRATY